METKEKSIVAIDVSKASFAVYWKGIGRARDYGSDVKGISKLAAQIQALKPTLVVLECTGGYEQALCEELWKRLIPVCKVNPGRVRHFCRAKGYLAKTDPIDAKALYEFGMAMELSPQDPPPPALQAIKKLFLRRQQLMQMIVTERNHLQAPGVDKAAKASIKRALGFLTKELKSLDAQITAALKEVPEIQSKMRALKQQKGVGPVLLAALIALVPELGTLNRRTVAALIGVAPFNNDSGEASKKRSIKGGRCAVRSVLYMATLAAIRTNGTIKTLYRRLVRRGTIKMVAVIACMRKFIIYLNSIARQALLHDQSSAWQGA